MTDTDNARMLGRVRNIISTVELDCRCRDKLDQALQRFADLELRRDLIGLIADGRRQSQRIAALLDLLRELDEIQAEESDRSIFEELALLFDAIAAAAAEGAGDMRRLASLLPGDERKGGEAGLVAPFPPRP
jgi:hypothetical protein